MEKLTKGIQADLLLCINKHGIYSNTIDGGETCYLSMTGRGPNLPCCKKVDKGPWVGK